MTQKGKVTSFSNLHNQPWETKEISVYGAARAFIKQIQFSAGGTDLTHVSIPSIFLLPYSMLEFVSVRVSAVFHELLPLPREPDPQKRLEGVLRYLIGMGRQEDLSLNHKPCNPILGEIHKSRIDHEDGTFTYVLCEQTVHHPPTSAFELHNPTHGVTLSGNLNFGVLFHSNSVSVATKGGLKLRLRLPDGSEELYLMEEGIPDMLLKNVIFGTKYVFWDGSLHINCPQTGFHSQVTFTNRDTKNMIQGVIWNEKYSGKEVKKTSEQASTGWGTWLVSPKSWFAGQPDEFDWMNNITPHFELKDIIAKYSGECGDECWITPVASMDAKKKTLNPIASDKQTRYLLVNPSKLKRNECSVYPRAENLEDHSSIVVWRPVGEAIVADDLDAADKAKVVIEEKQRAERAQRKKNNEEFFPEYFELNDSDGWSFWAIRNRAWYERDISQLYEPVNKL